jgi:hypothetical protein
MWKIILAIIFLVDFAQQVNGHVRGKYGILIIGGITNDSSASEPEPYMQILNPKFHELTNVTTFWANHPVYDMALTSYYDGYRQLLYVTGGHSVDGATFLRSTYIYDVMSNNVIAGPDMIQGRAHHGSMVSNGKHLYVFGGLTKPHGNSTLPVHLDTCEKLVPLTTVGNFYANYEWQSCRKMPRHRWAFASIFHRSKVFIIGGLSGVAEAKVLASVDILDTVTNTWSVGVPMPRKKSAFAAALLGDDIYVCGGTMDGIESLKTCDIYNTIKNRWRYAAVTMNQGRVEARMVVYDNVLYVLGGSEKIGSALQTIEEYNPVTKKFTVLPDTMSNHKLFYGAVSVELI